MNALDRAVEYYRRIQWPVIIGTRGAPDDDYRAAAAELARLRRIEKAAEGMAVRLELEAPNCPELEVYEKVLEAK